MVYIISNLDETKFITLDQNGKFTWTTSKSKANRYEEQKAQNVINNCLAKPTSDYKLVQYLGDFKENAETAIDSIENHTQKRIEPCDWDKRLGFDVMDTAIKYKEMLKDLENEKVLLNNQLIILSRAMVDLYHYKEQHPKISAVSICRMYKFEVGVLQKRRECKERLFFVDRLIEELRGEDVKEQIDTFMESKHMYRVRILERLFESGTIGEFDDWYNEVLEGRGHESKTVSTTTE